MSESLVDLIEELSEEYESELRRCGWPMSRELVFSAVSVYLRARMRKLNALDAETPKEKQTRLKKKRAQSRRYRENGPVRDVTEEVFSRSLPEVEIDIPMPPVAPPKSPWAELEERRERIADLAEKRRDRY